MNDSKIFTLAIMMLITMIFMPSCARKARQKKKLAEQQTTQNVWEKWFSSAPANGNKKPLIRKAPAKKVVRKSSFWS
ncbi:hypothetical protein ACFLY6_02515 [Candidatus Dependentiae bacterium]